MAKRNDIDTGRTSGPSEMTIAKPWPPELEPVYLEHGSKGQDVLVWQQKLGIKADGIFGDGTKQATIRHQRDLIQKTGMGGRSDGVVDDTVWVWSGLSHWSRRVPFPSFVNRAMVHPARQSTMLKLFGKPADELSVECKAVENRELAAQMVYRVDLGPFVVSGHKLAIASLVTILAEVEKLNPDLFSRLSTAGMLCCRAVRGSHENWSNHSWGTAIDIKIDGMLDPPGDGHSQTGLLALVPFFNDEGWYWGGEFSREDAMHFECGETLVKHWHEHPSETSR